MWEYVGGTSVFLCETFDRHLECLKYGKALAGPMLIKVAKNGGSGEGSLDNFLRHEIFFTPLGCCMLKHGFLGGL